MTIDVRALQDAIRGEIDAQRAHLDRLANLANCIGEQDAQRDVLSEALKDEESISTLARWLIAPPPPLSSDLRCGLELLQDSEGIALLRDHIMALRYGMGA